MIRLEGIRTYVVGWIVQRKEGAERWKGNVVPFVDNELKKIGREACQFDIVLNGYMAFHVAYHEGTNYTIDLNKGTCVCGQLEISGIPYKYATRCLLYFNCRLEDYTSSYCSIEMSKAMYMEVMFPIVDEKLWPKFQWPLLDRTLTTFKRGPTTKERKRGQRN